jgi:hypothetical protein
LKPLGGRPSFGSLPTIGGRDRHEQLLGAVAADRRARGGDGRGRRGAHRDQLDSLLDEAARANLSARETLILLCERGIARKDHRRIEMALKLAHFPAVKELAGFDFEAQPSIDPRQIRDLAASRWIANGENVLLLGPSGVGKTHLSMRRSWPDTRRSSRRRRRWSLASPKRTARGGWTRNCWRCPNRSC